jgi:hypothetical protein
MPEFKSIEDVKRCGLEFVQSTARPITIGDREIQVTVSVGVCTIPITLSNPINSSKMPTRRCT